MSCFSWDVFLFFGDNVDFVFTVNSLNELFTILSGLGEDCVGSSFDKDFAAVSGFGEDSSRRDLRDDSAV